jgi:hypothetical protein
MATVATQLNSASGFASGEIVTATKLNNLVNTATVTGIVNADIDAAAAIAASKLALTGAITDTQLATGAVTGAAGGGKIAASAITGQTTIADPLASGDEFLVHDTSASALRRVAFNAIQPVGSVLQTVQVVKTTLQNCSTAIPYDNTIPQNAEGDEIFTATITPSSASNKILVSVVACGLTSGSATGGSVAALFKDSGANAIAVGNLVPYFYSGSSVIEFLDTPATTSAITYKVRAGANTGSFYLNGTYLGVQLYGGAQTSSITLQEIKG